MMMKLSGIVFIAASLLLAGQPVLSQNRGTQRANSVQQGYKVSGKVIDAEDGSPLEVVNIVFDNNSFWAVTDLDGRFSLNLNNGEYHYEVSYVGYETAKGVLKVNGKDITNFNIRLQASSLSLAEVTVTAKQQAMGSSSVIDQTALQHLQPKSIEDMLQLTPGSVTHNTKVNDIGQASIREVGSIDNNKIKNDENNSMGAAIVLDGAPLSNDATLMTSNTARSGISDLSGQSSTGIGLDLRTISPDNVESIEMIRGIPSVEYGNLTSGAIIVKTKKGYTPWEVKGKTDPNSKMASIGKGFTLPTGTTVNLSADYTSSYNDIRYKSKGFERFTGSFGVSQTFFRERPLSVNAKVSYYQNLNTVRKDPQQRDSEKSKSDNKGFRFILNGDWNIKSALVSNISYNFSASYSHQRDEKISFMNLRTGVQPISSATSEGEREAPYLKGNYYSEHYIDGKPLSLFGQLKANRTLFFSEDFTSAFKLGAEFAYDANRGEGYVFDPYQPPVINDVQTIRPRPYTDIPAIKTLSAFFENKTIMPIGTTSLTFQAGVRANRLFIDRSWLDRDDFVTFDPRVNVEYSILNGKNNSFIDNLSLTGGWGMTSKMPSLAYLYPDKAYFDQVSYNHVEPFFAVLTTRIVENTGNIDIKPSTGRKTEIGLSFEKGKINGMVTFFYENYQDEFSYKSTPFIMPYNRYEFYLPGNADEISFAGGKMNYTVEGQQHNGVEPVSVRQDTMFYSYSTPQNSRKTRKKGIEYSINFGQLPYIRTSLVIDGSWLWVRHLRSSIPSWSTVTSNTNEYFPYMRLMPAGTGDILTRTSTNFRFITHIPEVRMVFTTTAQVIWRETEQEVWIDDDGNDRWYQSENYSGTPCLAVDPVSYMDKAGNIYEWDTKYRGKEYFTRQYDMISRYSVLDYFGRTVYPGHVIFNFRLTKEFGKNLEVSFLANNMFNTRKIYVDPSDGSRNNLALDQYFGAEIKLKL
ncbi:MAG: TonB-dependent receptor [Bacteroidaceae bacterium]|nr:TonB-dependent receptor [Bacteroidaceae bacterium]